MNGEYDPNKWYEFVDKDGNWFSSRGDNGYVWQSITEGIPISVNQNGDWYTEPYLEQTSTGLKAHIPEWFKNTNEYAQWQTYASQIPNMPVTQENVNSMKDILKRLGSQGALRNSLSNDIAKYGITEPALQAKYVQDIVAMVGEGKGYGDAKISLFGNEPKSVVEIAREYRDTGKTNLSDTVTSFTNVALQAASDGAPDVDRQNLLDVITTLKILNYVDDNYTTFGKDNEFRGLLEASTWQKINNLVGSTMSTLTENSIFGLPARFAYGIREASSGRPFNLAIEDYRQELYGSSLYGGGLEGVEGWQGVGNTIGTVENIGITVAMAYANGTFINAKVAAASPGTILSRMGTFKQTLAGGMAFDLVMNDLPIDAVLGVNDLMRYNGDINKVLYNPDEEQNLFGLYGGPKVASGFVMNLVGDAILDVAIPVAGLSVGATARHLDDLSGGAIGRFKNKVALVNLKVQQKLTDIPVVGTGWKKFINYMIGTDNANKIREARKASIAKGSMGPYKSMQNALTMKNHGGAEVVQPMVKRISDELGIADSIKNFQKQAKKYGGIGEVSITWDAPAAGQSIKKSYTVTDQLPRQVKQGLLDTERLSELKGEIINEGGVLSNPLRDKEIADIEMRLSTTPQEIKDFAQLFSDYNKRVDALRVDLGLTTKEWHDAMVADPRWEQYMTRQALTPGYGASAGGGTDPTQAKIFTAKRKGYYAKNYIDPTVAIGLKIDALGRAYVNNEINKMLTSFQISQGKVVAGASGVDAAKKLTDVRRQIAGTEELRKAIKYDDTVGNFNKDMTSVTSSFRKINELQEMPNGVNLKAVYDPQTPAMKELINDFNSGKIKYADGVKSDASLSDYDADSIIHNTYALNGNKTKVSDNIKASLSSDTINAGMTDDGVPYRYTIEDGQVTSFEKITDAEGMAEAFNSVSANYKVTPQTIISMGESNAYALNRTALFYNSEMPNLPSGPSFKLSKGDSGALGWIPTPGALVNQGEYGFKVVDGHLQADAFPVYLSDKYYAKGKEAFLEQTNRRMVNSGWAPKNAFGPEAVPVHENGHGTMARLTVLELNRKVDAGEITLPTDTIALNQVVHDQWESLHRELCKNAIESMGLKFTNAEWKRQARTISDYAASSIRGRATYKYETFSEAMLHYEANGANSSPFALAIVGEMRKASERFTVAAEPGRVFAKNGLDAPKSMFKGDQYAFPSTAKTDAQKAQWLDGWRQKNPYMKKRGLLSVEDYQKANTWDTFFGKEIRAFDANSKSTMPDTLISKNGDFLDDLHKNSAKMMVEEIKKASVNGFDEDLATMVLSHNSADVGDAMDNFIIRRVNQAAEELAANLPGGATVENLNKARATLWNENTIQRDVTNMVQILAPDLGVEDIQIRMNTLFDTQAKGFAAMDSLPIETRNLVRQEKEYAAELAASNRKALKEGKGLDENMVNVVGDVTHVLHYKDGGEDVYAVVSDPVLSTLFKNPNNFKETALVTETIAQLSNFISRTYRLGTTGLNPLAFVRNVLRDPLQATIQGNFNILGMTLSPDSFYRSLRGFGLDDATINTVMGRIRNWAEANTMAAELRGLGLDTPSGRSYRSGVEKATKNLVGVLDSKPIKFIGTPLEKWESMFRNQVGQQSFIRNYRRTGSVDKAMASALFDTSNSTTNFSHSVGLFKRATSTVPYLSSAINGTRSFWTQFNIDPVGMISRITAGFMAPAMAITAWNLSSEERRNAYMNLPEWYRDTHLVLVDIDGGIMSFPIPDELGHYYGTARRLIEYTQEASPYALSSIMAQGVFGFLPVDVDGFFGEDGTIQWQQGLAQMGSGLLPQAVTTIYEWIAERDLFTGQDLSTYDGLNKTINALSNIFGTGIKNVANDIGMLLGASSSDLVGKSTADTLARDLFGMGFDNAKTQFMELVGNPSSVDPETGKETKATGLFAENEKLQKQIEAIDKQIAYAPEDEKAGLEEKRQKMIDDFTSNVANLTNKYMQLYSITGGLEEWQKNKLVQILTLGGGTSSAGSTSYQSADASEAFLNERSLAQQRYVAAGLPAGPSISSLAQRDSGSYVNSIEAQAAINRFYGTPRQAATDYQNAIKESGLKNIRNEFYDAISQIYDAAEAQGTKPDYDLIEKIQARYLQAVDAVLVPIINQYSINILNNADFIDAVRRQVNGMIPSDDWRQSVRNAKKFLSTKDFPTATVDVKKWLIQRYSSNMRNRNIDSDPEVTERISEITTDINEGRAGAARGKIESLRNGVNKANFYISTQDFQTLTELYNMVR